MIRLLCRKRARAQPLVQVDVARIHKQKGLDTAAPATLSAAGLVSESPKKVRYHRPCLPFFCSYDLYSYILSFLLYCLDSFAPRSTDWCYFGFTIAEAHIMLIFYSILIKLRYERSLDFLIYMKDKQVKTGGPDLRMTRKQNQRERRTKKRNKPQKIYLHWTGS